MNLGIELVYDVSHKDELVDLVGSAHVKHSRGLEFMSSTVQCLLAMAYVMYASLLLECNCDNANANAIMLYYCIDIAIVVIML